MSKGTVAQCVREVKNERTNKQTNKNNKNIMAKDFLMTDKEKINVSHVVAILVVLVLVVVVVVVVCIEC